MIEQYYKTQIIYPATYDEEGNQLSQERVREYYLDLDNIVMWGDDIDSSFEIEYSNDKITVYTAVGYLIYLADSIDNLTKAKFKWESIKSSQIVQRKLN